MHMNNKNKKSSKELIEVLSFDGNINIIKKKIKKIPIDKVLLKLKITLLRKKMMLLINERILKIRRKYIIIHIKI